MTEMASAFLLHCAVWLHGDVQHTGEFRNKMIELCRKEVAVCFAKPDTLDRQICKRSLVFNWSQGGPSIYRAKQMLGKQNDGKKTN